MHTFKRIVNRQIPRWKDDMAKDDAGPRTNVISRARCERARIRFFATARRDKWPKRQIICNGLSKRGSPCPNNLAFSLENWVAFYKMSAFGGIVAYLRSTFWNAMAPKASEETKSKAGSKVAAKTRKPWRSWRVAKSLPPRNS